MKPAQKTATQEMIDTLNAAEEALAVLDQIAGHGSMVASACWNAYKDIKAAIDEESAAWAGEPNPGEGVIHRCSEASKPYHTEADGPCDVWSTDDVCSLHIQRAEEQMSRVHEQTTQRADYFRRKQRGEDV